MIRVVYNGRAIFILECVLTIVLHVQITLFISELDSRLKRINTNNVTSKKYWKRKFSSFYKEDSLSRNFIKYALSTIEIFSHRHPSPGSNHSILAYINTAIRPIFLNFTALKSYIYLASPVSFSNHQNSLYTKISCHSFLVTSLLVTTILSATMFGTHLRNFIMEAQ